jgi:hypothetical protein
MNHLADAKRAPIGLPTCVEGLARCWSTILMWARSAATGGCAGSSLATQVTGGLLDLLDEAFEVGDLIPEGSLTLGREIDPGPGAFPLVPLLDVHQLGLFQDGQMLSEVTHLARVAGPQA